MAARLSVAEKVCRHEQRRIGHMAYTAARMVIADDGRRGVPNPSFYLERYITELRPYVVQAINDGIIRLHVPATAARRYIKEGD